MSSVNNSIPFVPENTIDPAAGLNESIAVIDALLQLRVLSVGDNAPPASPSDGARYIVGDAPTGAWAGQAGKLARWLDGLWSFYTAHFAVNFTDGLVYVNTSTGWLPASSGAVAAADVSIIDAGEYFTATDVEGALQEVGGMIGDIATALDAINGEVV